ncbi:hypothetical protein GGR54DRAFT_377668 [Hypoxylon sp. NC1633]|nr:hypothetical protein GGR54DRAFT_377668 [Hypoxylon sp. NC1633]
MASGTEVVNSIMIASDLYMLPTTRMVSGSRVVNGIVIADGSSILPSSQALSEEHSHTAVMHPTTSEIAAPIASTTPAHMYTRTGLTSSVSMLPFIPAPQPLPAAAGFQAYFGPAHHCVNHLKFKMGRSRFEVIYNPCPCARCTYASRTLFVDWPTRERSKRYVNDGVLEPVGRYFSQFGRISYKWLHYKRMGVFVA